MKGGNFCPFTTSLKIIEELFIYTDCSVQELWVSQWKQVIMDDWLHWLENRGEDNVTCCVVPENVMALTRGTEAAESRHLSHDCRIAQLKRETEKEKYFKTVNGLTQ